MIFNYLKNVIILCVLLYSGLDPEAATGRQKSYYKAFKAVKYLRSFTLRELGLFNVGMCE